MTSVLALWETWMTLASSYSGSASNRQLSSSNSHMRSPCTFWPATCPHTCRSSVSIQAWDPSALLWLSLVATWSVDLSASVLILLAKTSDSEPSPQETKIKKPWPNLRNISRKLARKEASGAKKMQFRLQSRCFKPCAQLTSVPRILKSAFHPMPSLALESSLRMKLSPCSPKCTTLCEWDEWV